MSIETLKILPHGAKSSMSMNEFTVFGISDINNLDRFNGKKGEEICAKKIVDKLVAKYIPKHYGDMGENCVNWMNERMGMKDNLFHEIVPVLNEIADGLSCIIYSLYTGNEQCKAKNTNLNEYDWEFWKKCKTIILVGTLACGKVGEYLLERINCNLVLLKCNTINIKIYQSELTQSLYGCAIMSYKNHEGCFLFDFGNSMIKRGFARYKNNGYSICELKSKSSQFFLESLNEHESAIFLHKYICKTIIETIEAFEEYEFGEAYNISICISNNILNGTIANRGRYKCLRLLSIDYRKYLEDELRRILNTSMKVTIINDAEAVAVQFRSYAPYAAVITLGTLMGVSYPRDNNETI